MKYSCYGCAYEPYASKDEHRCKTCQDCTPLGTVHMKKWEPASASKEGKTLDRLTCKIGDQPAVPTKFDLDFAFQIGVDESWEGLAKILNRLAAYEDTGLEPEEIISLNDFSQSQCAILLAKVERLTLEKAEETAIKEFNYEMCNQKDVEITTLKKALKMSCEDQTEHCPYTLHGRKRACSEYPMRGLRCQDCAPEYYIHQAQEQEVEE